MVSIDTLSVLAGRLSPKALALVVEWAAMYRLQLLQNWALAERKAALQPVPPLE